MKRILLPGVFLLFIMLFPVMPVHADPGDNCVIDITAGFPEERDWQTAYILQANDGSVWQRAIVNKPEVEFRISESGEYHVTGFTEPYSAVQVFFAAAPAKGQKTEKPTPGTCFEAGESDQNGLFSFSISPRFLWSGMGHDLMVDAFYRHRNTALGELQLNGGSAASFLASSSVFPKFVKVAINSEAAAEIEQTGVLFAKSNSLESGSFSDVDRDIDGNCHVLCEAGPIYRGVELMPWKLPSTLLGGNLAASGGDPVMVGRSMHTYFVGIPGKTALQKKDVGDVALKALSMETIKRSFGIDSWVTSASMREFADQNGGAKYVRALLLGEGDMKKAELNLRRSAGITGTVRLNELFPFKASTEATWAEDFLALVKFWTGGLMQNTCLMLNDRDAQKNFFDGVNGGLTGNVESSANQCDFVLTNGKTPTLLLRTKSAVKLIPDFKDTKIVSAAQEFTDLNGWALPVGEKLPLSYHYAFSSKFTGNRTGEMCVKKESLPTLLTTMESKYGLDAQETTVLAHELQQEFPKTTGFVKLSLADPADIAARFVWKGNGKKLDLLQLFFELTPDACEKENLIPPDIFVSINRDGFEAGIL